MTKIEIAEDLQRVLDGIDLPIDLVMLIERGRVEARQDTLFDGTPRCFLSWHGSDKTAGEIAMACRCDNAIAMPCTLFEDGKLIHGLMLTRTAWK